MANDVKSEVTEAGGNAPVRARTTPLQFLEQVNKERKKITWPSMKETWLTTLMVFIMVGVTMVFFAVVDSILNYGQLLLIGAKRLF